MGVTPRKLLREKGTPCAEPGPDAPGLTDEQITGAMLAHPVLTDRPIMEAPLGMRLRRSSEAVLDLLDNPVAELPKQDGEVVARPPMR